MIILIPGRIHFHDLRNILITEVIALVETSVMLLGRVGHKMSKVILLQCDEFVQIWSLIVSGRTELINKLAKRQLHTSRAWK